MKYIFVDWNYFQYRAIFSWNKDKTIPATWKALSLLITNLKDVEIRREDKVILAIDGQNSWRKDISNEYKSNRKEKREAYSIDWNDMYSQFNRLVANIERATNFHIIKLDKIECDDIIAVGCRKFKEHEVIIISTDSDFDQLLSYEHVKFYSPLAKKFKKVKNPYKSIQDKIKKERTDNLLSPILTQQDYEKRNLLVNLLTLPDFVEEAVNQALDNLPAKEMDLSLLLYPSLQNRISEMYSEKQQLTLM